MNDVAAMYDFAPTPVTVNPVPIDPARRRTAVLQLVLMIVTIGLVMWLTATFMFAWSLLPSIDFGRMCASAELFLGGCDMYEWTPATSSHLEDDYCIDLYNMNPPHFHLLLLPFAMLSKLDFAFVLWCVLSGYCLYHCLTWTLAEIKVQMTPMQKHIATVMLLGFSGTNGMLFTAQLAFVLLVPVTLMWLAARRGWWVRAGALLGLVLSLKPFFGVLLVYLCMRRRWRAVLACVTAGALCFAVGIAVFGWSNHVSWYHRMTVSASWAWLHMNASVMGMLSRTFTESVWYVPVTILSDRTIWLLWIGIGGALGVLTLAALGRGDSPESVDQDFALLLAGSVLFGPLGWIYYLWLALPPLLPLLARGWPLAGLSRRQRWLLLLVMLPAFFCPPMQTKWFQPDLIGSRRSPTLPPIGEGWLFPPQSIATVLLGDVYFWGLLAAWGCLVSWGFAQKRKARAAALGLEPLAPEDYRISVVMPVYSETDTVRPIVEQLVGDLTWRLCEIIILQSPRASERSRAICRQLLDDYPQVRLHVQQNNPGLGWAVREGLEKVRGNLVLMIDSDGEMEIDTVPRMLAEMERGGHAMVAASRWLPGGGFQGYDRKKYYLNWCFQQVFRWLFWTPLHDLTYGFKLLRAELVRGIAWQGTLHEIACETTLRPVRLGVSVAEVPSRWTARTHGVSQNTFWRNFRYVRMAASILVRGVAWAGAFASPPSANYGSGRWRTLSPSLIPLVKES